MGPLRPVLEGVMLSQVPTPLIGRAQELAEVLAELADPATRLLTVTGPVGVGKSRLAAAVVRSLRAGPTQVRTLDLSRAEDFRAALELPGAAPVAPELVRAGRACPPGCGVLTPEPGGVLLVLDDCDEVLARTPERLVRRVADLLADDPGLTVLATGREALGLYGERRYVLGPLRTPPEPPPGPAALEEVPSVALFVQRARAAAPGFALTDGNAADVAAVCREVDGLPLGIELAAARVRVLPPRTLRLRLRDGLDVLEGRSGDTLSQHRTLRSALAAGYDRLGPAEQGALRRLSVFPDGFGLDAAQAVAGSVERPVDLLLESLLERSAVVAGTSRTGEPRFALLRTTRRYAAEQLAGSGEEADAYRRLAAWVRAAAETPEDNPLTPADRTAVLAAVRWLLRTGELAAAVAVLEGLAPRWLPRCGGEEGAGIRALVEDAATVAETAGDAAAAAAMHQLAGLLAAVQGEQAGAQLALRRAVALHRERGDDSGAAQALTHLGQVAARTGDTDRARQFLREAVALAGDAHDPARRALALVHLATALATGGEPAAATARAEEAARIWADLGDRRELARTRSLLAGIAAAGGDPAGAGELARAALLEQWELKDRAGLPSTLEVLAGLGSAEGGDHARAALLLGAAAALRDLTRTGPGPLERAAVEQVTGRLTDALGPAALRQATAQGRRESLADVVAVALQARAPASPAGPPPPADSGPLTPREREVADLIARGMTNRQIARQLGIAEWTAVNHVRHIMRKLECPSRIHVARWMARQGPVR